MNATVPPGFQRPPFPSQMSQKSTSELMTKSVLMAKQKQDEYIKQLATKVDVLTTHNRMLEVQIAQKAAFLCTPPIDFPVNLNPTLVSTVTVSP